MNRCRICGDEEPHRRFRVREMMNGTGEVFAYFECAACGCLQLETFPEDLSIHYRNQYYSYRPPKALRGLKGVLARRRDRHLLLGGHWPGAWIARYAPAKPELAAMAPLAIGRSDRILDVGCGSGSLLLDLAALGFTNLLGIDPFNEAVIDHGPRLRILPIGIDRVEGRWDVVMMHHSLEHVPDPEAVLRRVAELLVPGGRCLVRLPIFPSLAWERYGVDWVQLDAPRHLFLHSRRSLEILAAAAGLEIRSVAYDSTPFQFWASEQYRRGIPLSDARSYGRNPGGSVFTPQEIREFRRRTARANREGVGDQIAMVLGR